MKEIMKKRNSSIELLRIICMFFIILHHSYIHSRINSQLSYVNSTIFSILSILGHLSNNLLYWSNN